MWCRKFPALMFILAFLLYLRNLVPDVFLSDFAEFQYLPARLGLPHPNGFPFYMLLAWLWSHLPLGTLAWRMNLLSALGGALAVALTTAFAQRLSERVSIALLAGGLLILTPTFWFYSLAAERYTLNLALLVGALWTAWEARRKPRNLYLSTFLLALGLATHPSDALLVPFWLAYLLWHVPALRRSPRPWMGMVLAGIPPLILYAYIPWRWAAFTDWPLLPGIGRSSAVYRGLVHVWYRPPLRWDLVWHYITGLGSYGVSLIAGGWREALSHAAILLPFWRAEIPWPVALLALLGAFCLLRRDTALVLILGAFAATLILMVAYIEQGKNDAYLLPAFWVTLFLAAFALDAVLVVAARVRKSLSWVAYLADDRVVVPLLALVLLTLLWHRYPNHDLSRQTESRRWWETILAHPLENGAGLLAHWSDLTPLWYLQQIEGRRLDLWGLFPPDPEQVIQPWLETGNSLYLAAPLHGWAPDLPQRYTLVPWGKLVRILPPGQQAPCPSLPRSLATPPTWPLAITSWDIDQPLVGGTLGFVRFCWRARTDLPRDTFLALHLRPAPDAPPLSVHEPLVIPWYPVTTLPAGTEGLAVIPVRLPLGTPPGAYTVTLTVFRLHPDGHWEPWPGADPVSLGKVDVAPGHTFTRAALTDEVAPPIPLSAGPLILRAWRVSHIPVRPGDPVQLDMLWQVRERPAAPVTLRVRFWGRGARGLLTSPQPLLPHLPLDAWQPGALLRSTHTLRAPRGLGDHTYLLEPRLFVGDQRVRWCPTGRLVVGTIQVKDRPHVYTPPAAITPVDVPFGNVARLVGYTLTPSAPHPGETLTLTLYWQAEAEVDIRYTVFVHLVNAQGDVAAQHDSPPANGSLPTDLWVSGEIIADSHPVSLPADLSPGMYTLRVGLYNPMTGERVPIRAPTAAPDRALDLASIRVAPL